MSYSGDTSRDYIAYPLPPVEFVSLDDFEYRGLNDTSTFKDVMNELGNTKILTEYDEGGDEYYVIKYKIDGMLFRFIGSDEQASDGVGLSIFPVD